MKLPLRIVTAFVIAGCVCAGQVAGTALTAAAPTANGGSREGKSGSPEGSKTVTATAKPYVVGSLDVLDIRVWNDPRLSGIFPVGPDGTLSMPLLGAVKADGLTVAELTDLVREKLSALVKTPEVNIQVARILSKKYFVFGEVGRQGEFPLTGDTTVLDAFANCGGFKDFANEKKIYILRGTQRFNFNYKDVSKGKHMEQNILLQNGDRIFVP